ncbi:restriction endonuclease [Sphingobacterium faecium]
MKAGKEYELLIEKLYKELAPNAIVVQDDKIMGRETNTLRQIDVSIRYEMLNVKNLIIVQAKDYKHKADVNVVGEFLSVMTDVNANKGIIICSSGFTGKAIEYAKSRGVELLTLHSAEKKNWQKLIKIEVQRTIYEFGLYQNMRINIAHKAGMEVFMEEDMFSYDQKNIVSSTDIIVDNIIKKNTWKDIQKGNTFRINLKELSLYHVFDGEMLPIDQGFIAIKFIRRKIDQFFIDPDNYIYEVNHTTSNEKLHDLTISLDNIEKLDSEEYLNDTEATGNPIIKCEIYRFNSDENNRRSHMIYSFSRNAYISGGLLKNGDQFYKLNERNKFIIELENKFRNE